MLVGRRGEKHIRAAVFPFRGRRLHVTRDGEPCCQLSLLMRTI